MERDPFRLGQLYPADRQRRLRRFDSLGDYCYRAFDLNGDGAPEAEYYHLFPGEDWCPYSNKFVVNFNGERDLSYLDFENLTYPDERTYDEGGKYRMNIHGSGFFVNSYCAHPEASWETPIAWYDFDCDGKTNMTMRVGDTTHNDNIATINLVKEYDRYAGTVSEFELAYELNGDTSDEHWNSLDLLLSFYNYKNPMLDYIKYEDYLACMAPLKGSEVFHGELISMRCQPIRQYLPYLDGAKIGLEHRTGKPALCYLMKTETIAAGRRCSPATRATVRKQNSYSLFFPTVPKKTLTMAQRNALYFSDGRKDASLSCGTFMVGDQLSCLVQRQ